MLEILKPGGLLVVEDGDLTSAGSSPASSLHWFADLFGRLGPTHGLDYALANHLYHLVKAAGFLDSDIEIHQPAVARGEDRFLLKWSVEEAGPHIKRILALYSACQICKNMMQWKRP